MEDALKTLQDNNTADATALAELETALSSPATESTGDLALAAVVPVITTAGLVEVFGAAALSDALTAAGYTVTSPPTPIPVTTPSDTTT